MMNGLTNTELVLLVIGGLFGLGVIITALSCLLEWAGMAIEALGVALAQIVVGVLLSPFLILYGVFRMLFPKKPQPPQVYQAPPVRTATTRRRVTVIEEEIVIWKGTPGQAMRPIKIYRPGPNTVPQEVIDRLNLEMLRREKELRDARR